MTFLNDVPSKKRSEKYKIQDGRHFSFKMGENKGKSPPSEL